MSKVKMETVTIEGYRVKVPARFVDLQKETTGFAPGSNWFEMRVCDDGRRVIFQRGMSLGFYPGRSITLNDVLGA